MNGSLQEITGTCVLLKRPEVVVLTVSKLRVNLHHPISTPFVGIDC
jgi:hypothetical protein